MSASEGGSPSPVTSNERRLPVHECTPECIGQITNHWPTTHRFPQCRIAHNGRIRLQAQPPNRQRVNRVDGQRLRSKGRESPLPPGRDSAMAVSVGQGEQIDIANIEQRDGRPGSDLWTALRACYL